MPVDKKRRPDLANLLRASHIELMARAISAQSSSNMNDGAIEELYWRAHPRFRWFKSLARGAAVLDIGAGRGGLALWRSWLAPDRSDIRLWGIDLERGEHAERYVDWRVTDLERTAPDFGSIRFDAFVASHVIAHLHSIEPLLSYLSTVSAPMSSIFIEWPSPWTTEHPERSELAEHGLSVQVANFHDDASHVTVYTMSDVVTHLEANGFRIVEQGEIRLGLFAEELLVRGVRIDNAAWRQFGYWATVGWPSYVVADFEGPASQDKVT